MTDRRKLKKELSKLKSYRKAFPRLIDCSEVYGDNFFNNETMKKVDGEIKKIENAIYRIDAFDKPC